MEQILITEENIESYYDHMDAEAAEYIFRKYGRGLAMHADADPAPQAVIVWKYVHMNDREQPGVRILWMVAEDQTAAVELLEAFEREVTAFGAADVQYECTGEKEAVLEALQAAGYEIRTKESPEVIRRVGDFEALIGTGNRTLSQEIKSIDQLMFRKCHAGVRACMAQGKMGALEDFDTLPFDWFEPKVSCCIQSSGNVCGFLLVHRSACDRLVVKLLGAWRPATNRELLGMIKYAIVQAVERYSPDTQVVIRPYNEATEAIVRQMFPKDERRLVQQIEKRIIQGGKCNVN